MTKKKTIDKTNDDKVSIVLDDDVSYRNKPSADDRASGRGRPEYVVNQSDYDKIRCLAISKRSHKYIANYIGISKKTLYKYYSHLLDECGLNIVEEVEQAMYYNASVKMNVEAQKFLLASHKPEVYSKDQQLRGSLEDVAGEILKTIADKLPD